MEFIVTWSIEIEADSHQEAAQKAREIQLDPNSTATYFSVTEAGTDVAKDIELAPENG